MDNKKDKHFHPFSSASATREKKQAMDTSILQSLASKSPTSTNPFLPKASSSATYIPVPLPCRRRWLFKVCCMNSSSDNGSSSTSGSEAPSPPVRPPITPPDTVEIRFKRGSRRRRQLQEDGFGQGQQRMKAKSAPVDPAPKKWEEMSLTEKALELYVGEKGLLFWLNKFAYASIFIVIGAWILFRFVGPALNLYELDSPPLAPTSMFKGS